MRGKGISSTQAGTSFANGVRTHPPLLHKRSKVLQDKFSRTSEKSPKYMHMPSLAVYVYEKALKNWDPADDSPANRLQDHVTAALKETNSSIKDATQNYIEELIEEISRIHVQTTYSQLVTEERKEVVQISFSALIKNEELYKKDQLPADYFQDYTS